MNQPGVLLPLRLETRFTPGWLLVRIVPDEVWFTAHDPRPTAAELTALQRYLDDARATGDAHAAWRTLATAHGGGRAAWLVRTFLPGHDPLDPTTGPSTVDRSRVRSHGEVVFPDLTGFPDRLEVWGLREDGALERLATTDIDHVALRLDLPVDPDPDGEVEDPRWWESFPVAEEAGLGVRIPRSTEVETLAALLVVGIGDDDPAELLARHRDAGQLSTIAPGTPTAPVDGAPAASRDPDLDAWWTALTDGSRTGGQQVGWALTADPQLLAGIPGDAAPAAAPVVRALWPALWGFGLREVLGVDAADEELAAWAAATLHPQGMAPTLRVGKQPYGLLPVTALQRWRVVEGEPALEQPLSAILGDLRRRWADAAAARGTVAGTDAEGFLDRLAQAPVAPGHRLRLAWPLETWYLLDWALGTAGPAAPLLEGWDTPGGIIDTFSLDPHRRYAARGVASDAPRPLVVAATDAQDPQLAAAAVATVRAQVAALAAVAAEDPARLARTDEVLTALGQPVTALLPLLVLRSLQLAVAEVVRTDVGDTDPLLEPAWAPAAAPGRLEALLDQATSASLSSDTPAAAAAQATIEGARALADLPDAALPGLVGAVVDSATHRIDPWVTAPAWRRLATTHARSARRRRDPRDPTAAARLGAYGWVDAPRPAPGGPTDAGLGLLLAPSDDQASVAAILRDRAVNDAEPDRWHLSLDSAVVQDAERLAARVRAGATLSEALGALVEDEVGDRSAIDALRALAPSRVRGAGRRRVCDGLALRTADLGELATATDQTTADTVARSLARWQRALEGVGDLLVAEGVYELVEGRTDRAAAALDAAAGLAAPPDLEVLATRRRGRAVHTRSLSVLPTEDPPPATAEASPARLAEPALAAFVHQRTGPAADLAWRRAHRDGTEDTVTLADLGLEPVDALALTPAQLERLVAAGEPGVPPTAEVVDDHGSRVLAAVARSVAALGGPASRADLAEDPAADLAGGAAVAAELRSRLDALIAAARELADRLASAGAAGVDEAEARALLRRALAWGIAPVDDEPHGALARAAAQLHARMVTASATAGTPEVGVDELVGAITSLASASGRLAVLATHAGAALPAGLSPAAAVDEAWLPVVAAVREPLARLEASQLEADDGPGAPAAWRPLVGCTNRPDDLWQADAGDTRHLVVAHLDPRLDPGALGDQDRVAVGLIDRFSETVPDPVHTAAAAFGFDAPAARAPQTILLAVPPIPGQPLDAETVAVIITETRELARARMATPADLTALETVLPTALLPVNGPTHVPVFEGG